MNFRGWATLLILGSATVIRAQVRELWRSEITNPAFFGSTNYLMGDAAVDVEGNTIVGGKIVSLDNTSLGGFIAKFDGKGVPVWEFVEPLPMSGAFESLATDATGNVFLTFSEEPVGTTIQVTLVKLSPEGREIWRIIQSGVSGTPKSTAIKSDAAGNVFMAALLARDLSPSEFVTEWQITKLAPEGRVLWRTMLPGHGYLLAIDMNSSRNLALTEDGGVLMTGLYGGVSFPAPITDPVGSVTKLDARGRVEWWTIDYKGLQKPGYHSITLGSKGTICAVGAGGPTVFSKNGKALHTSSHSGVVAGMTSDGGFLLRNQSFLYAIPATGGKERWGIQPMDLLWDVLPDGKDGWLGVGGENHYPYQIQFARINHEGQREWFASLPANPLTQSFIPSSDSGRPSVLLAPDGTVRIVGQVPFNNPFARPGIAIMAFAME